LQENFGLSRYINWERQGVQLHQDKAVPFPWKQR
jgi:hypothetical protein